MSALRLKNQTEFVQRLQSMAGLVAALELVEDELDTQQKLGNAVHGIRSSLIREIYDLIDAAESREIVVANTGNVSPLIARAA